MVDDIIDMSFRADDVSECPTSAGLKSAGLPPSKKQKFGDFLNSKYNPY